MAPDIKNMGIKLMSPAILTKHFYTYLVLKFPITDPLFFGRNLFIIGKICWTVSSIGKKLIYVKT